MSKILTKEEAEKIVKFMLDSCGFTTTVLNYDKKVDNNRAYQLCNVETEKKETGMLWWKKTIEVTTLDPVFTGWCWEECIEKLHNWIENKVKPRLALAEKFRDEYARHENAKALDNELSSQ